MIGLRDDPFADLGADTFDPDDDAGRFDPVDPVDDSRFQAARSSETAPIGALSDGRPPGLIRASPFVWRDPRSIPLREWLYGYDLVRRFLTVTVSPGGIGKSSLVIVEVLAMVTGRNLLGVRPTSQLRCWYWNGEDPLEELQRRVTAAMIHYGLSEADLNGGLFLDSGRDTELVLAKQERDGIVIAVPIVDALVATIRANEIDVLVIDPFVSSHHAAENDNPAIDRIAKTYGKIAEATGCAIHIVHHVKKVGLAEVQIEDSRGAVALIAACRVGRVLNQMTKDEAERFGVENNRLHFRVTNGKLNLAPPPDKSDWFRIAAVDLGNGHLGGHGDNIGVVTRFELPNLTAEVTLASLRTAQRAVADGGPWREHDQAKDWVGYPIARALGLHLGSDGKLTKNDKARVKAALAMWSANGMFRVVEGQDEKRMSRKFVEVGEWATD